MLARFLIILGVIALLHSISSYIVPNLFSRGWRKAHSNVSPTIAFSSSRVSWNVGQAFKGSTSPIVPTVAQADNSPPRHIILNDLKTGMQLEGIVVSSSSSTAFINTGVVKVTKGGTFAPVHGTLHISDIPKGIVEALRASNPLEDKTGGRPLLAKKTPITVFVKEIFKQAGRFTLTTDGTISKEEIRLARQQFHDAGAERRRTRRLRRQLETVAVGTTATGVVEKVIDEGVLVTVTSLGALNVTGLILKNDLPKHLQVPVKLKPKYQNQILEQDFVVNRPITTSIMEVHPEPNSALVYNMKLLFENFDAPLADDEDEPDTGEEEEEGVEGELVSGNDEGDEEYDDEDTYDDEDEEEDGDDDSAENIAFDAEVRQIYEELLSAEDDDSDSAKSRAKKSWAGAGSSQALPVSKIYAWDAVQDMIEAGEVQKTDIDKALHDVGVSGSRSTLTFEQFRDFVELLQDDNVGFDEEDDGEDNSFDDFEDEEKDEEDEEDTTSAPTSVKASSIDSSVKSVSKASQQKESDGGEETGSTDYAQEVREMFDELLDASKSSSKRRLGAKLQLLPVESIYSWESVTEMIEAGDIHKGDVDKALAKIGVPVTGGTLSFAQFRDFVELLQNHIADSEKNSDDEYEGTVNQNDDLPAVAAKTSATSSSIKSAAQQTERETAQNEDEEESEEELVREMFEDLLAASSGDVKKKGGKQSQLIPVESIYTWEAVIDMIEAGDIQKEDVDKALAKVGVPTSGGTLSFAQFRDFAQLLQNHDNADDDEKGREYDDEYDDQYEEDVDQDDDLPAVAAKSDATSPSSKSTTNVVEQASSETEEDDDEFDVESALKDYEQEMREIYDELLTASKSGSKRRLGVKSQLLPVESIYSWESVKEMIESGDIHKEDVDKALAKIDTSSGTLSFEQFRDFVGILQENVVDMENDFGEQDGDSHERENDEYADADDTDEEDVAAPASAKSSTTDNSATVPETAEADEEDGEEDDEDDDEDNDEYDAAGAVQDYEQEVRDLYEDLLVASKAESKKKGGKQPLLVPVESIYSWEAVTDMIEAGEVQKEDVDAVLTKVGVPTAGGSLTFEQFRDFVELIQDKVSDFENGYEGSADRDGDDAFDDGGEGDDSTPVGSPVSAQSNTSSEAAAQSEASTNQPMDEDDADFDEDAREVFDELLAASKGSSKKKHGKQVQLIPVESVYTWEAVRGMIETGEMQKKDVDKALTKVGVPTSGGTLSFEQFRDFAQLLQNEIFDSENEREGDRDGEYEDDVNKEDFATVTSSAADQQAKTESDQIEEDEEGFEEAVREMYDELLATNNGKKGVKKSLLVPVESIYSWEAVTEMIEDGVREKADIDEALAKVGVPTSGGTLSFEQFREFVVILQDDEIDSRNDEGTDGEYSDEYDEDADREEAIPVPATPAPAKSSAADDSAVSTAKTMDQAKTESDQSEEDEEGFEEAVREMYDELLATNKVDSKMKKSQCSGVPVESIYSWEAVTVMIEDGVREKADIDEALAKVGVPTSGGTLSFEQFREFVAILQQEDSEEDRVEGEYDDEGDEGDFEDDDFTTTEFSSSDSPVPVAAKPVIKTPQQTEEENAGDNEYDDEYSDDYTEEDSSQVHDQSDHQESSPDQTFEEVMKEVFDELKNDEDKLPVESFKAWSDVQELLENEIISPSTLDLLIGETLAYSEDRSKSKSKGKSKEKTVVVDSGAALSYAQFSRLVRLLEEAVDASKAFERDGAAAESKASDVAEAESVPTPVNEVNKSADDEDFVEMTQEEKDLADAADAKEAFDELSRDGKVVTVADFLAWDEVKTILSENLLDQERLDTLIHTVNGDLKSPMNLGQFSDLLMLINDSINDYEEDDFDENKYTSLDIDDGEEQIAQKPAINESPTESSKTKDPQATKNSAQKIAASLQERAGVDDEKYIRERMGAPDDEGEQSRQGQEYSEEELHNLARKVFEELTPTGSTTVPTKVFAAWSGVQEEVDAGMLTSDEVTQVLKKADSKGTGELNFEQFVEAMDMLEMKIEERTEQMEAEAGDVEAYDDDQSDEEPVSAQKIAPPPTAKITQSITPAASAKAVPSGTGVGFDPTAPKVKAKANPTETDPTEELDNLTAELYDELRGKDKTLTVEKFRAWDELQDSFKKGILNQETFDKVIKSVGVGKSGALSVDQFSAALDLLQEEAEDELDEDDDTVTDLVGDDEFEDDYEGEGQDERENEVRAVKKGKRVPLPDVKIPSAADIAASMAAGSVTKKDGYDFSHALRTLDELHQKQTGNRKPTSSKAKVDEKETDVSAPDVSTPTDSLPATSSSSVSRDHFDGENEEEKEVPEEAQSETQSLEENAREIYDRFRGARPQAMVQDFLSWDDVVDLVDCGAVTKEKLAKALGDAGITVDHPDKTPMPFDKFFRAVANVDSCIDFSKLKAPDLSGYGNHNIAMYNMNEDVAAAAAELGMTDEEARSALRPVDGMNDRYSMDDEDDDDDDEEEYRKPNKHVGKSKSKIATPAASAKTAAANLNKAVKSAAVEPMKAPKKKSAAAVAEELEDDREIEEMFADLSKGKGYLTEAALRKWEDVQGLVQSNIISKDNLEYFIKDLAAPAGRVEFPHFRKFVKSLDSAMVDEQGKILTPEQKHLAINKDFVGEDGYEDMEDLYEDDEE